MEEKMFEKSLYANVFIGFDENFTHTLQIFDYLVAKLEYF
jgi:hypothetical protein